MTESSLKICLGNTSADMDSVVGSMALSYYYYLKDNSRLYVPIINSKRAEFYLKLEQVKHFKNCQLNENEHVIFIEELEPLDQVSIDEVVLFDHNKLDVSQEKILSSKVKRIVDHHVDSEFYKDTLIEKEIKLIGSATTLVADRFIKEYQSEVDKGFSFFLAAPIVLDSHYFEPMLKDTKWTEQDFEVHQFLNQYQQVGKDYWQKYNDAKYDIELNLKSGIKNMMIKDYKSYFLLNKGESGIGVSSIVVPLNLIHKTYGIDELRKQLGIIMKEKNLGMFCVVTNYADEDKKYHKEILVYGNPNLYQFEKNNINGLVQFLDQHQGYQLQNREQYQLEDTLLVQWEVGNLTYSRKNLEVLLKQFYEQ